MINLNYKKINFNFKRPAGTSRGILTTKPSWFFILTDSEKPNKISLGECGLLPGLSIDDISTYEKKMIEIVEFVNSNQTLEYTSSLTNWPSIKFGFEILKKDYFSENDKLLFETDFTENNYKIPINGLIWMGEKEFMHKQIKEKLNEGWSCIKMKIGAINFKEEINLLKYIRSQFNTDELELRVDANGAFSSKDALEKLKVLSDLNLHSIEQPIPAGQPDDMAKLCEQSPLAIALDEELIGTNKYFDKEILLKTIKPQYIILKPSLLGGWKASNEWIDIANRYKIGYWATSALESNIGLNAIAQWTATLKKDIVHGLGTGQIYTNNFISPLTVKSGLLSYDINTKWNLDLVK